MPTHDVSFVHEKAVFVFDWDGTLFDSMREKTASFAATVSSYLTEEFGFALPECEAARLYRAYSGHSRFTIFRMIAEQCGVALAPSDMEVMSQRLFDLNRVHLADAQLFPDGVRLIKQLVVQKADVFVSSSMPQNELNYFVEGRFTLNAAFGSRPGFSKGREHIDEILGLAHCSARELVFIGDDKADDELCTEAGVDCIIVDRTQAISSCVRCAVSSLDEITAWLM